MSHGLETLRSARATVDLARLDHNYRAVAAASGLPLMPVVKADAYGHGAVHVARRLEALGAPLLAVAHVEEGAALRSAGIRTPIVVLAGCEPAQAPVLLACGLVPVITTRRVLETVLAASARAAQPLAVHLKVDTGMTRLGFTPAELPAIAAQLANASGVDLVGLMTHLSSADDDASVTERQLDAFDACLADLAARGIKPRWVHAANSAGLVRPRPTHTLARPGLLLYGLKPRPLSPDVDLRPVMTVSARITRVQDVPPGTAVSYGRRWIAERPSRVATVPLGYADGVPRAAGMAERGRFAVGGRPAPVAGTVSMDFTMLDLTDLPDAKEGDEVVFFGDSPTAWDVAGWAGTIAWDVLTGVGANVPRVYVDGGQVVAVQSKFL